MATPQMNNPAPNSNRPKFFSGISGGKTVSGSEYETGTRPRPRLAVQAPVKGKAGWMSCSKHEVHYREALPSCPMCEQEKRIEKERSSAAGLKRTIERLEKEIHELKGKVSHLDSMRLALDLLGDDDLLALKEMLYIWRRNDTVLSVALREERFTSKNGAGVRHVVSGFKIGKNEHHCTSIGGVAMARAFSEVTKLSGRFEATQMLATAMAPHLNAADSWRDR